MASGAVAACSLARACFVLQKAPILVQLSLGGSISYSNLYLHLITSMFPLPFFTKTCLFLLLLYLSVSCIGTKKAAVRKSFKGSETFSKGHTGFVLYDPEKQETIYSSKGDQYFIPASNTKLFTFYAAQKILGDSIPALKYMEQGDSLIFWGTGDPSFLHADLKNTAAYTFLKENPRQLFYANNFNEVVALGPGWSWDWYNYYFATERSAFPVYGNAVRIKKDSADNDFSISPKYFTPYVTEDSTIRTRNYSFIRDHKSNRYGYLIKNPTIAFEIDKPFIFSDTLVMRLLEDTLKRQVQLIPFNNINKKPYASFYSITADSLYKRMLQNSDNFIAEQLLVLSASKLFDSLNTEEAIAYAIKNYLSDLPDVPQWADGSGLSKNNLFTPRSIVALLQKIDAEYPQEKMLHYLPTGGKTGTLRNYYKADTPYVHAKTGSLNNVSCLSGYLITKSGKKLIFSFMHNNYVIPSSALKDEMERILWHIHMIY